MNEIYVGIIGFGYSLIQVDKLEKVFAYLEGKL